MTLLGPTAAADKEEVAQACLDMAQRHPVTIAFVPANDPNSVCATMGSSATPRELPPDVAAILCPAPAPAAL